MTTIRLPTLPLFVGLYDDGGEVNDGTGMKLFTFDCDDDTKLMNEQTQAIANWTMKRIRNFDYVIDALKTVAKNLESGLDEQSQAMQVEIINKIIKDLT